jgi:hypothetical protein
MSGRVSAATRVPVLPMRQRPLVTAVVARLRGGSQPAHHPCPVRVPGAGPRAELGCVAAVGCDGWKTSDECRSCQQQATSDVVWRSGYAVRLRATSSAARSSATRRATSAWVSSGDTKTIPPKRTACPVLRYAMGMTSREPALGFADLARTGNPPADVGGLQISACPRHLSWSQRCWEAASCAARRPIMKWNSATPVGAMPCQRDTSLAARSIHSSSPSRRGWRADQSVRSYLNSCTAGWDGAAVVCPLSRSSLEHARGSASASTVGRSGVACWRPVS